MTYERKRTPALFGRLGLVVVAAAALGCDDKNADSTFACPVPDGSTVAPTMCPVGSWCCPVQYAGTFACAPNDQPCPNYCTLDPKGRTCPFDRWCSSDADIGCVDDCPESQQCSRPEQFLCCAGHSVCANAFCYALPQLDGG
jgi:hypothetical protein